MPMPERLTIEIDREADGRWIVEIPSLPGVLAYGATRDHAALASRPFCGDNSSTSFLTPS